MRIYWKKGKYHFCFNGKQISYLYPPFIYLAILSSCLATCIHVEPSKNILILTQFFQYAADKQETIWSLVFDSGNKFSA